MLLKPHQVYFLTVWKEEGYEIITFTTNVGQEEDFGAVRAKALKIGDSNYI